MSPDTPWAPPSHPRWPLRYVFAYQHGSSVLPSSSLLIGVLLLLTLFLAVMAGIFFAEGNRGMGWALTIAVAALAYGLWRLGRRKGYQLSEQSALTEMDQ